MAFGWRFIADITGPKGATGDAGGTTKAVRLEAGQWVWDVAGGTHYLFPEPGGGIGIHATAWPVPNPAKPELDW